MNADGTSVKRLTQNPATDLDPVWSPNGQKLAFYSERDGNGEIYIMNADGSNPINLTMNPATDSSSSWSPDGKNILFDSKRSGSYSLYVINIETRKVTTLPSHKNSDGGLWAP